MLCKVEYVRQYERQYQTEGGDHSRPLPAEAWVADAHPVNDYDDVTIHDDHGREDQRQHDDP